jgi:glycosyl transferase, family 25
MAFQHIFERTYIINLPERLDRKAEIQRELRSIGSGLMAGKVELYPAAKPVDYYFFPTRGTLGCYLSHLSLLKQARADNLGNVLLIEDDL